MPVLLSFSQALLAATISASTIGTYVASTPPNADGSSTLSAGSEDSLAWLGLTKLTNIRLAILPLMLLSFHTSLLVLCYPNIPASLHGPYGLPNKHYLNKELLTWSSSTVIPLFLNLFFGIPLRLIPYAALGGNFTFYLSKPEHLMTDGIYSYVQHPSYVGLVTLLLANIGLLGRPDGVVICWMPPRTYRRLRPWAPVVAPIGLGMLAFLLWTRVREEEDMLRAEFGQQWELWHLKTARFIPGVL